MPAARGVKRSASKSSATSAPAGPKNKKKRGAIQLEIPTAPKKRGCVLTCGQGDVGQLGLGEDVIETTKFKQVPGLGNKIVDVHAGGMHTVALDSDGKVWSFGCNDEGALGRPTSNETDEGTPSKVDLPLPAVAISAGDSHSAALLDNGDVYAWGAFRDSHGSMGLVVRGREGKACKEPVKVDIGETAVAIASGGDHLVVLSTTGSVYTMGCGEQGQLGRLSQRSASRDARQGFSALLTPGRVSLRGGAVSIWAGHHASFALQQGKMAAWGLNNYGQLGITGEKRKTALYSPTECDAFGDRAWASVAAGQHHSLALDDRGAVHAVGRVDYGRLGLGDRPGDAEQLEPIPKLANKKCISIAAGTCSSFAVTDTGESYAWGMGSEGQLGTGARNDCTEPCLANTQPGIRVAAGGQHSVLLAEDPTAQKEASPAPEMEVEEEQTEEDKRPTKRQKKQEQDEEISSTSAQPDAEKVNGNEKKENDTETPMEVDDTAKSDTQSDTQQDKQENEETKTEETTQTQQTEETEDKQTDPQPETDTQTDEQTDTQTDKQDEESEKDTIESSQESAEKVESKDLNGESVA